MRAPSNLSDYPRVIVYINIHFSPLYFSLQNDILNHRNILCILFFIQESILFLINIYFNSSQLALKYLKNTEVNISNILIMTGNFNIRDSVWDLNYPYYLIYRNTLFGITDSFQLELSQPGILTMIRTPTQS